MQRRYHHRHHSSTTIISLSILLIFLLVISCSILSTSWISRTLITEKNFNPVKYQAFNKFTLLAAMKKNIKIEVKPEKDEGEKKKSGLERATTISDAGDLKLREKVQKILSVLNHYYPNPPIPLDHSNDFTFLVAVVLSAQTTDGKVNEVTKELFKLADTPEKMSKLEIPFVQQIIQPVGLAPRKASFIVNLSKLLIERHGGKVPGSYEELENLPGVGHKTASVIMSQLFGENSFAVDTHVHRLALRWGLSKEEKNVDKVQKDLCRAFPEETWNKAHLQMIYFGREYCPAKNHSNADCPICSWIHHPEKTKRPLESDDLSKFSPQKRAKNLVFYGDRVQELSKDPSLARFSSPNPNPTASLPSSPVPVKLEFVKTEPISPTRLPPITPTSSEGEGLGGEIRRSLRSASKRLVRAITK